MAPNKQLVNMFRRLLVHSFDPAIWQNQNFSEFQNLKELIFKILERKANTDYFYAKVQQQASPNTVEYLQIELA